MLSQLIIQKLFKSTTENFEIHFDLLLSCRKRIKSTSKYIYQTLFLDGENSDVTIQALGKEWKLHKLYLKQVHVTSRSISVLLIVVSGWYIRKTCPGNKYPLTLTLM